MARRGVDRRTFVKAMAGSAALASAVEPALPPWQLAPGHQDTPPVHCPSGDRASVMLGLPAASHRHEGETQAVLGPPEGTVQERRRGQRAAVAAAAPAVHHRLTTPPHARTWRPVGRACHPVAIGTCNCRPPAIHGNAWIPPPAAFHGPGSLDAAQPPRARVLASRQPTRNNALGRRSRRQPEWTLSACQTGNHAVHLLDVSRRDERTCLHRRQCRRRRPRGEQRTASSRRQGGNGSTVEGGELG